MEWVLDKSVFDFSFFGKLVLDISLFNCIGFSDVGLSVANEMVECAEIKELTTAIVNRLIEKIEVSEPQTIDGEKVQNIRIFYKFVGEIN